MIALDISLLNQKSPYYVVQDADGDLLFETDFGVKYGISFELNEGMMNYPAYVFGILNKNGQPSPNDRKLRDTILAIIEEFFRANGGVLLYICATGDGMQKYRFHLFLRWFNTYEHRDLYEIRTLEDVMDDNTPNYGAIIVEKTHPDLELILARFDDLAAFLKKPIE
ncbi:hypothetical protein SAMN04487901_11138 [Prevotella communis]|uniref:Uncharacterized protein n=1 Tax=Prevotella communis TaxID=2913614 RepID=A0A1G7XPZ3_9BACT|nr:hypothetical protein SAMN04487901_11138 [Prevotella communis]